jgi:hypothetical protein
MIKRAVAADLSSASACQISVEMKFLRYKISHSYIEKY